MAEFTYSALIPRLEAILRADPRLRGVHITQELDAPTEFPWVQFRLVRTTRIPFHIVAGVVAGAPDDVTTTVHLVCWEMSAQGAADACRMRDRLVTTVIDVLRDNYTLGGLIDFLQPSGIEFAEGVNETSGGIYANAVVTLDCRVLA